MRPAATDEVQEATSPPRPQVLPPAQLSQPLPPAMQEPHKVPLMLRSLTLCCREACMPAAGPVPYDS